MHGAAIQRPGFSGRKRKRRSMSRAAFPDIAVLISGELPSEDESEARSGGPTHRKGRGGPGSRRRHGRRGRRARRGDARLAILLLLDEEPRNGYGLMQEIEERSGGVWRPSPGSIYPALSQLEDEGLIEPTEAQRKAFALTAEGSSYVEQNRETMGTPWKTVAGDASSELSGLRESSKALTAAAIQVGKTGNVEQLVQAGKVMDGARRSLYRILAGESSESDRPQDESPA